MLLYRGSSCCSTNEPISPTQKYSQSDEQSHGLQLYLRNAINGKALPCWGSNDTMVGYFLRYDG